MEKHSEVIESSVIGTFAGESMHAWTERAPDGSLRFFEDYEARVFCPSLGRDIGLTLVREVTA